MTHLSGFADVNGFAGAVAKAIGATASWYATCAYRRHKVVVGRLPPSNFDQTKLSGQVLELTNVTKYFIKPVKHANQSEFRFIWQVSRDVEEPRVITCPEAVAFCFR